MSMKYMLSQMITENNPPVLIKLLERYHYGYLILCIIFLYPLKLNVKTTKGRNVYQLTIDTILLLGYLEHTSPQHLFHLSSKGKELQVKRKCYTELSQVQQFI